MTERDDLEKQLSDLRTEVYEARTLVIKSDNLMRTMHADIKAIGKTQERFQRRQLLSSIGAYALFAGVAATVAIFGTTLFLGGEREVIEEAVADAAARISAAEEDAEAAQLASSSLEEATEAVMAVYEGLTSESEEERLSALEDLEGIEIDRVPAGLSRLIDERSAELRRDLVRSSWELGRRAYQADNLREAERALTTVFEQGNHLPEDFEPSVRAQASYFLGAASNRLGNHEKAVRALKSYIEGEHVRRGTLGYAHLLLGDSLERMDRLEDALRAFQEGAEADPAGEHAAALRGRARQLARAEATSSADE